MSGLRVLLGLCWMITIHACALLPHHFSERNMHDVRIPLKGIDITGEMIDFAGRVTIVQKYQNLYNHNIEAKYLFTLDEKASVTAMSVTIAGRRMESVIREKSDAREVYEEAISQRKTTGLLEQESNGIYTMNVGNLAPNDEIEVELVYITELDCTETGEMKFILPTNIFPKYTSQQQQTIHDITANQATTNKLTYASLVPFQFQIDLNWTSQARIEEVKSYSNEIIVTGLHERKVNIRSTTAPAKGDFNLFVRVAEIKPTVYSYRDQTKNETYFMIVQRIPDEVQDFDEEEISGDYTIVLDRSGSMNSPMSRWSAAVRSSSGSKMKIDFAREAVRLFVESLPANAYFNIVSFGSTYEKMFPQSVPYSQQYKEYALQQIAAFAANFGGTEIFTCLSDLLTGQNQHRVLHSEPEIDLSKRQWKPNDNQKEGKQTEKNTQYKEKVVLLITDGEVSNPDAVISLAGMHSHHARVFTIGIGQDAHRHLVKGIAKASNAQSEMLVDNPDVSTVVTKMLAMSEKSYYSSTQVNIGDKELIHSQQAVYPNSYVTFYQKVADSEDIKELVRQSTIQITAINGLTKAKKSWDLMMPTASVPETNTDMESMPILSQLYAANRIRTLEAENQQGRNTAEIIQLSLDYKVMSDHTSFVVVDEEQRKQLSTLGLPKEVIVPQVNIMEGVRMRAGNGMAASANLFAGVGGSISLSTGASAGGNSGSVLLTSSGNCIPTTLPSSTPSSVPTSSPSSAPSSASLLSKKQQIDPSDGNSLFERDTDTSQQSGGFDSFIESLFPFKRVDGSFIFSEESLAISPTSHTAVDDMLSKLAINADHLLSKEIVFNLLLWQKLKQENSVSSRYVMIIRNLERWLIKQLEDKEKGIKGKDRLQQLERMISP